VHSLAAILIVLGGLLCFANWMGFLQSWLTKKFHSAIPLFGAALLGAGMLLIPSTRYWACQYDAAALVSCHECG
jgi:hypothetical protein